MTSNSRSLARIESTTCDRVVAEGRSPAFALGFLQSYIAINASSQVLQAISRGIDRALGASA